MNSSEIFLLLLVAVTSVAALAQRVRLPSSIAFLLGGLGLVFVSDVPQITLNPEWVFIIFLPPLLFEAAYFTSLRDFRANLRPIMLLAVGLVAATSFAVGAVLQHILPGVSWAIGILLGAIIAPPDAAAAISVARNFNMPRRITTVLEGESLINDASGLVIYSFALTALATGGFSPVAAAGSFVWLMLAGAVIGALVGRLYIFVVPIINDVVLSTVCSFLTSYAAYALAEAVHASGVIAVVCAGLVVGWLGPETFTPVGRIKATAVWQTIIFLINGFVFMLIGLQLPEVLAGLRGYTSAELAYYAACVCATVIGLRIVWVFATAYGLRFLFPRLRAKDPYPPWQSVLVVSWTGMRGVISLAMALSLPVTFANGHVFEERNLLIFFAYAIIFVTLVGQGLTLPILLKFLKLDFDALAAEESWLARKYGAEAALQKLSEMQHEKRFAPDLSERVRVHYTERLEALGDGPHTKLYSVLPESERGTRISHACETSLWREVLAAEHDMVVSLRKNFTIGDEVLHEVMNEIDLLRARYG